MIVAVSDIHLGIKQNDPRERHFRNFLVHLQDNILEQGDDLVLLGDIFDFWRRDLDDVMLMSEGIIEKLMDLNKKGIKLHYVIGNHDYYMNNIAEQIKTMFETAGKRLVLSDRSGSQSTKFLFMHGYQLEVMANPYIKDLEFYERTSELFCRTSGITASLFRGTIIPNIDILFKLAPNKSYKRSMMLTPEERLRKAINDIERLAVSNARTMYLGMKPEDWFVFGHTHNPFLDTTSRTINTGSWMDETGEGYPCLVINQGIPSIHIF